MLALLSATFPDANAVDLTQSAIDLCEALRPLTRELEQTKAADRDRGPALSSGNRSNSCSLDPLKEHEFHRDREKVGGVLRKDHEAALSSSKKHLPVDEPLSHVSSSGDDRPWGEGCLLNSKNRLLSPLAMYRLVLPYSRFAAKSISFAKTSHVY
jgi:hypothetical protein